MKKKIVMILVPIKLIVTAVISGLSLVNADNEETQELSTEEIIILGNQSALDNNGNIIPLNTSEKTQLAKVYKKGNAYNEDQFLDILDAKLILKYYTEVVVAEQSKPLTKKELYIYDVNDDNQISADDAQYLLTYYNAANLKQVDENDTIKDAVEKIFRNM